MRAHCVSYTENREEKGEPSIRHTRFVGSEAEARQLRMELMKSEGLKRKDIEVKLIEIPTTKAELLGWLNTNFGA